MIKLIIFDLDGVLVTTKNLHYVSLNRALSNVDPRYEISMKDHLETYDGLPTSRKLKMLTEDKGLSPDLYHQINLDKQNYTFDLIREEIKRDHRLINILRKLKNDNYKVYVASNCIRETTKLLLFYSGLLEYVDYYISNEDVKSPKPNPEMYLRCMIDANVGPDETLIVEDSPRGIEAAQKSKAHIMVVENPDSITYDKMIKQTMTNDNYKDIKLKLSNFNILIPMAGEGSRFQKAGYTFPKPLIEVNGKPMIQVVVDNLGFDANYIYVVRKEHYEKYNLKSFLNLITPNCTIVQVDKLTEGAACTTLLAKEHINNENPLIIANSDQFIEWNQTDFYYKMVETKADGGIVTFENTHVKWSYAQVDEKGNVIRVAEKDPISRNATCLDYHSTVLLSNGHRMRIGEIVNKKLNLEVISYNTEKNIFENKKITNWFKFKTRDDWYVLSYKESFNSKLNERKRIFITGDHNVITNRGDVKVENLNNSDKILTRFPDINNKQMEIINGSLLGDSYITRPNTHGNTGKFVIKQSMKQKEWFDTKKFVFDNFINYNYEEKPNEKKKSGNRHIKSSGSLICGFSQSPVWNKLRKKWYPNGIKIVPQEIELTSLTLAVWYMDDGHYQKITKNYGRVVLCTDSFDNDSINILVNKFKKIGIEVRVFINSYNHKRIYIYNKGFEIQNSLNRFFDIISKHIIPSMYYKLPLEYFNRYDENSYKNTDINKFLYSDIIIKKIDVNEINNNLKYRLNYSYCIEVEDNHNFIINDMVVRNCGIYYYKKGSDYVKYAEQMIDKDVRVNGEFYVCPIFNEFILDGKKIKTYDIKKMWGLGTPEDMSYYVDNYRNE